MADLTASVPIIDSQAESTNPTTSTVLADTGAITAPGVYEVLVCTSASANAQFVLQHRNAANGGNISDTAGFYTLANSGSEFRGRYFINYNERLRVLPDDNLTGTAFCTIYAWRVQ